MGTAVCFFPLPAWIIHPSFNPPMTRDARMTIEDQRWDEIIRDPGLRPALCAEADQVLEDYRAGKTAPLDPKKL